MLAQTPTTTSVGLSVPDAAEAVGVKVDRLRLLVRRRADLAALFVQAGPFRVLPPDRVETLRSLLTASPTSSAAGSATCPAGRS